MIRARENSIAWRAGALSLLVHGVLLVLLLVSVNWKSVQPMSVAEVELWDSMPSPKPVVQPKPPEPPKPVVEIKPEPKPEPEPKAEIQLKKKPVKPPKEKVQKPIEKPPIEKPKEEPKPKAEPKKVKEDALKKLQQAMLAEDTKAEQHDSQKQEGTVGAKNSQANAGEIAKYSDLIRNKIKQHVNKQLCGSDKPELEFKISLMPTGEVTGTPKLLKSSGIPACDEAVERAILQSQPLPVPTQSDLFSQLRDLNLKFHPNDDN
jgi:colicin import membrane protein